VDKVLKAIGVDELLRKEFPKDYSWIEPAVLTKGGTLALGGQAKVGKSFVCLELCRALACGKPLFGNPDFIVPSQCKVLYIDAEMGERTDQDRIKKIFGMEFLEEYKDYLSILPKEIGIQLNTREGIETLKAYIRGEKPDVLVLDPITFLYHKDENQAYEINKLFFILAELKKFGGPDMSIIFTHHFGKPPWQKQILRDYDPLSEYNFRGSSKWKDGADTLITMQREKELSDTSWQIKMRFLSRHAASYPEGYAIFNEDGDLRVKWYHTCHKLPKLKRVKAEGTVKTEKQGIIRFSDVFAEATKDD